MIRRPRRSTLFPSTTLSRSLDELLRREVLVEALCLLSHRCLLPVRYRRSLRWLAEPVLHGHRTAGRCGADDVDRETRSEEHTSELQSRPHLVCRLLLDKMKD